MCNLCADEVGSAREVTMNLIRGVALLVASLANCTGGTNAHRGPAAADDAANPDATVPDAMPDPDARVARPGVVVTEYDRFTKQTIVWLKRMDVSLQDPRLTLEAMTRTVGGYPVGLFVERRGPGSAYVQCRTMELLVSDQPIRVPRDDVIWNGDWAARGVMVESLGGMLSRSVFARMARANTVDIRACSDEFSLRPEQIAKLAEFARTAGITR